ncbi:hypothetical protein MGN70_006481 [Eutypa lata]|nr:hypothetical protein MGN70_006481 [Eutypa lata]
MAEPLPHLEDLSPDYVGFNQGRVIYSWMAVMAAMATCAVGLRVWARRERGAELRLDDWLIFAALPFLWALTACGVLAVVRGGVGKHLLVNLIVDADSFSRGLKFFYISQFAYGTVIALVKASILALYWRIFPTRFMKTSCHILGGVVFAWWMVVVIVSAAQCRPIRRTWTPGMTEGTCIDTCSFLIGNAVPNIITDAAILSLPVYQVSKLNLKTLQKAAVTGIFLLGGLVVVASCFRLKALVDMENAGWEADYTIVVKDSWLWTVAEPAVGVLCACLPTLRPLVSAIFGSVLTKYSTKKSARMNESSGITTIGGRGSKSRFSKGQGMDGSGFERLKDIEAADRLPVRLWPKGYCADRETTVVGTDSHSTISAEIALGAIHVRNEVRLSETTLPR